MASKDFAEHSTFRWENLHFDDTFCDLRTFKNEKNVEMLDNLKWKSLLKFMNVKNELFLFFL